MAVKSKTVYVCQECGYESPKWQGKCPECGCWNTLQEQLRQPEIKSKAQPLSGVSSGVPGQVFRMDQIGADDSQRYDCGSQELNRVLGGGIVKGSVVLLGGDPGIGKSTLLLQICQHLCKQYRILYITGEESVRQIKLRAVRLGVDSRDLFICATTDMSTVIATIDQVQPDLVMVDSIQTMSYHELNSAPGSVAQVRQSTQMLTASAKASEIPIFIVGHVNKDGAIAGPKVLEHMVDAVLYFEGDRNQAYRILRAVKNRYGSTNEIGVFEMSGEGLVEVENPSLMLLAGRPEQVSGTCVSCILEGTRPILAEVQALVSKTGFGTPRRTSSGFDYNRMALILAVLEKRMGYFFGNLDVYLNVVGGLRLDETAADLPVALSLMSNLLDIPLPEQLVAFGEIGLAGEIRAVPNAQSRVSECYRLGFDTCILPEQSLSQVRTSSMPGLKLIGVRSLRDAFRVMKQ